MDKLGSFYSWTILSENEAVKRCDKSFFEHNTTGVPLEIVWFFDAEKMVQGESRNLSFLYSGREYKASIRREAHFSGRYKIVWESSLGYAVKTYNTPKHYPALIIKKTQNNQYDISFDTTGSFLEEKNRNASKDTTKLINMINRFGSYIVERDGVINFQDRNTFLGREENYKTRIAFKAQDVLQYERWTEKWIDNGEILNCSTRAMSCAENLVNKHQQIDFKNKLIKSNHETQMSLARVIYNIYKSKGEKEEARAFGEAVSAFGGKYDTIAYLFFIKDSSRFLPISTGHLEKSMKSVGFEYKLSGNCSWENYIGFLDIANGIKDLMAQVLPVDEIRLIDAHSFLWVIGEGDRPTDFLNWNPNDDTTKEIEVEAEERLEAEWVVQHKRHSSYYYTRNNEVSQMTKIRASGKCELCNKPAPFNDNNGDPYLEAHHIIWLSRGGEDSTNNTVALCPNCHRRMHIVDDKNDIAFLLDIRK